MNYWWLIVFAVGFVVLFVLPRMRWLGLEEARAKVQGGAQLVDVRSAGEFASGSAPGALNVPIGELAQALQAKQLDTERDVLLFCASGARSAAAARQLQAAGFSKVHNLGTVGRAVAATRSAQ